MYFKNMHRVMNVSRTLKCRSEYVYLSVVFGTKGYFLEPVYAEKRYTFNWLRYYTSYLIAEPGGLTPRKANSVFLRQSPPHHSLKLSP
jgi:hypothetical protein